MGGHTTGAGVAKHSVSYHLVNLSAGRTSIPAPLCVPFPAPSEFEVRFDDGSTGTHEVFEATFLLVRRAKASSFCRCSPPAGWSSRRERCCRACKCTLAANTSADVVCTSECAALKLLAGNCFPDLQNSARPTHNPRPVPRRSHSRSMPQHSPRLVRASSRPGRSRSRPHRSW